MSIRLMSMVWDVKFPTQAQKLIALKLADYASDYGGSVFPAVNTMADQVGCDDRTVQRVLKAFRDCGLIELVKEGGKHARDTNEWAIDVAMLAKLASGELSIVGTATELSAQPSDTGDRTPPLGWQDVTPGVTPVSSRGGILSSRGDTGVTQLTKNHQDTSRARERARDEGAGAPRERAGLRLILKSDVEWKEWHLHTAREWGDAFAWAFDQEGAMVVTGYRPHKGCAKPILPPKPDNPKYDELFKARGQGLSEQSRRMTGEHAE